MLHHGSTFAYLVCMCVSLPSTHCQSSFDFSRTLLLQCSRGFRIDYCLVGIGDVSSCGRRVHSAILLLVQSRVDASKQSVKRCKDMAFTNAHPLLVQYIGEHDKELERYPWHIESLRWSGICTLKIGDAMARACVSTCFYCVLRHSF